MPPVPPVLNLDVDMRTWTPGQRWRWRRDLVIYLAHRQGLSHGFLADVFDLPRSRIGEILKKWRRLRDESCHAPRPAGRSRAYDSVRPEE